MEIPAAEFIECAHDELKQLDPVTENELSKELRSACYVESQNPSFVQGYILGVMTRTTMDAMQPGAKREG